MKLYYNEGIKDVSTWLTYYNLKMEHYDILSEVAKSFMEPEEIAKYIKENFMETAITEMLMDVVTLYKINRYSGIGSFIEEFMDAYGKDIKGYGTVVTKDAIYVGVNTNVKDWFPYFLGFEDTNVFEAYAKTKGIEICYDPLPEQ